MNNRREGRKEPWHIGRRSGTGYDINVRSERKPECEGKQESAMMSVKTALLRQTTVQYNTHRHGDLQMAKTTARVGQSDGCMD